MIQDIFTIIWKELKEIIQLRGKIKGGLTGILIFACVFGILMPLQAGKEWVTEPIVLLPWAWLPFILCSGIVADCFAGEKERHSLETLLASRLSDTAILFGKLFSTILYGWGLTLICSFLGLITVNIAYGKEGVLFYPTNILVGLVLVTFLVATLASSLGVLVSMKAKTVRQAQQIFSISFIVLFIPLFGIQYLPDSWKIAMRDMFVAADWQSIAIWALLGLALIDAILIMIGAAQFKRKQLITE